MLGVHDISEARWAEAEQHRIDAAASSASRMPCSAATENRAYSGTWLDRAGLMMAVDQVRLDVEPFAAQPWDTVVIDKAQTIKNPDSQADLLALLSWAARAALPSASRFRLP